MRKSKSVEKMDYILRLFDQTRRAVWKVWSRELLKLGIHPGQFAILNVLNDLENGDSPPLIPTWIAHVIFVEPHAVSQMLDRMNKLKLINKVPDRKKRNVINVSLTDKGRAIANKLIEIRSTNSLLMDSLSMEELEQFESVLLKLRASALKILGIDYEVPIPTLKKLSPKITSRRKVKRGIIAKNPAFRI